MQVLAAYWAAHCVYRNSVIVRCLQCRGFELDNVITCGVKCITFLYVHYHHARTN